MKYSIKETNKGYMIRVKGYKYFLWDSEHTKEKYIYYMLKYNEFRLGKPFGDFDDIYPIYFNYSAIKNFDNNSKIDQLSRDVMMSVVWKYYRSFISEDTDPKIIKKYAKEFKSNLNALGLDGLYEYVENQRLSY